MAVFKCKMCGGSLEVTEGMTVCECEYCGTKQTLPKTDNEQALNMFNRANHFRQQCEFDKAAEIYERMTAQRDDAELYWSIVLCRYGIEYVDDPLTKKKIPTCHRTQYKSILEDADYLEALSHADSVQKEVYKQEAEYIDKVQKGILEISNKEKPFDVFICYKETDDMGRRTPDSVLAQDLYYGLVKEGFKVFFSRITLESKLGTEYEPYIFAALNSAKVMVVVGTKPEYFNAVWVRNEWSRYLMLMQEDRSRTLIPAYKDMDPYDLPDALSMFQAQDMSKLGFMQDLIRGIGKIANDQPVKSVSAPAEASKPTNSNIENLLKRGALALEDGDWSAATDFYEQVLNEDVEEYRAYVGKLCAALNIHFETELPSAKKDFSQNENYRRAIRFADDNNKKKMETYNLDSMYNEAMQVYERSTTNKDFEAAAALFERTPDYRDCKEMIEKCRECANECIYQRAEQALRDANNDSSLAHAASLFAKISGYKDSAEKSTDIQAKALEIKNGTVYAEAIEKTKYSDPDNLKSAAKMFRSLGAYKDSQAKADIIEDRINKYKELEDERGKISNRRKEISKQLKNLGVFSGKLKKALDQEYTELGSKLQYIHKTASDLLKEKLF
ncbi:toll/interleukin-1 receptor domain-containing protein [Ruminococcus sp. FC2018]|uniref:toll/interleukin-1 receptor domain-containing protein n=1 Tax=Ruminococcus sp. FC2018 TaxID=1410617 RepID=UPI00048F67CD|nr:toll/interleukin-1 receptor domain-containing protein [Ruminococcus sp. FC2018]